jgi:hypothetical protein
VWNNVAWTPRYFWVNATWGTAGVPVRFAYRDAGEFKTIRNLLDVNDMLDGGSILGLCEMQLQLTAEVSVTEHCALPIADTYNIGVMLHSFVTQRTTLDRGPSTTISAVLHITELELESFHDFGRPASTGDPGMDGDGEGQRMGDGPGAGGKEREGQVEEKSPGAAGSNREG